MKGKRKKITSQKAHFKRRAQQRLGVKLNRHDLRRLCEEIQQGRGYFIDRQSQRVTRWQLVIAGVKCMVVYDGKRKTVVTVWRMPVTPEPSQTSVPASPSESPSSSS